jgi:WD40 repeat protein
MENNFSGPRMREDCKVIVVPTVARVWQAWWLGPGGVEKIVPLRDAPASLANVVYSAKGDLAALLVTDGTIRAWNLLTGQPAGPTIVRSRFTNLLAYRGNFSPDGRHFTLGSATAPANVWEIATGREVFTLGPKSGSVPLAIFSPDGTRIATVNAKGEAQLWEARTGEPVGPVMADSDPIIGSVFSPDGSLLATDSLDGVLRLWNGHNGEPVGKQMDGRNVVLRSVRFNADGTRLLTTSNVPATDRADGARQRAGASGRIQSRQPFRTDGNQCERFFHLVRAARAAHGYTAPGVAAATRHRLCRENREC